MNDIIINLNDNEPKFPIGWTPEKGQKIFVKCGNCGDLHEIFLGQGDIYENNECPNCGEEDYRTTYENLFEVRDVYYLYSRKKYILSEYDDLNNDINLTINSCKYLGETFFEEKWNINNEELMSIKDYLDEEKYKDDIFLINKEDAETLLYILLYIKVNNASLERFYIIDNALKVTKLRNINITVNLDEDEL